MTLHLRHEPPVAVYSPLSMTREAELHALLGGLFSPEELRIHLAHEPDGEQLVAALPQGAPALVLLEEAVAALKRRGLLDHKFFERLAKARPHRGADIARVAAQWADDVTSPAHATKTRAPASRSEPADARPPVVRSARPRALIWILGVLAATTLAVVASYLAFGGHGSNDPASPSSYLTGLPALLGLVGVSLYMLVVRHREPQTIADIMASIAERTRHLPQVDRRLSPEKVHDLLANNAEFRAAITAQDERIILEHLKRRHAGDSAALLLSCALIALSAVLYYLHLRHENELAERARREAHEAELAREAEQRALAEKRVTKIGDLRLSGLRDGQDVPVNTMDDIVLMWTHSGDEQDVLFRFELVPSSAAPPPEVRANAGAHRLVVPAHQFRPLWPDPTLAAQYQLSVVAQTREQTFRSPPIDVRVGLNVVGLYERADRSLTLYPKTADSTFPVSHEFKAMCFAEAPSSAPTADRIVPISLDVMVTGSKGRAAFPRDIEPAARCVYLGSYPRDLVKFTFLHD